MRHVLVALVFLLFYNEAHASDAKNKNVVFNNNVTVVSTNHGNARIITRHRHKPRIASPHPPQNPPRVEPPQASFGCCCFFKASATND